MSAAGHGLGLAMAIIFLSGEVTCYSVPRILQRRTYRDRWRGWGCWRCPRPWWAPGPRASLSSSTSPSTRCSRGRGWACAGSWSRSGTRSTWTGWVSRVTRVTCHVSCPPVHHLGVGVGVLQQELHHATVAVSAGTHQSSGAPRSVPDTNTVTTLAYLLLISMISHLQLTSMLGWARRHLTMNTWPPSAAM